MVFLSCNYISVKYCLDREGNGFNPETLTVIWMGAATLFAFLWVIGRRQVSELPLAGATLGWMVGLGVCNGAAQLMAWQGLNRLDPSMASFMGRFAPVMAIFMGATILHERIRVVEWYAIALMIAGGLLTTLAPTHNAPVLSWLGIILSLASAFLFAMQLLLAKKNGHGLAVGVMIFYRVGVAAVIVTVWALAARKLDFSHARPDQWAVLIGGAFIGPFLSYVCTFHSYRFWDMARSSMILTLQPLVVIPLALIVFGTRLTTWQYAGGFITIAGGVWLAVIHHRAQEDPIEVIGEEEPSGSAQPADR
ncbi:MAG: DMT family transporter [Planctomycetes bacterium]|nr:DMT family transporter [Planctomycetota bacterium]